MKQEPKTNRGKFNAIITQAEKIRDQLRRLQKKAQELADNCAAFGDDCDAFVYELELAELRNTAEDLAAFDFEDAIPDRADYDF